MKRRVDSCRSISRVRHWLAAVLAAALLLTAASAPATGLDMIASAQMMADEGTPPHAANAMHEMADSGCAGCDDTETKTCESSALCMTACGKLPLQLAAAPGFIPVRLALKSVREPDLGRTDLFPSPLRRPPRVV